VKFIHSSDLQIGKAFGLFPSETATLLQDARQSAVRSLGEAAVEAGASAVLIAGDLYEKQQMSQSTIARAIETMRAFEDVQWHLMPGNHDHYREGGLWDRIARVQLPKNVTLHTNAGATHIAEDDGVPVYLLPAPLRYISSADDLSAYMDCEATPEGAIRIGVAHGSVQGFGSEGEASNYVAPNRADTAGLSYLAMGDWHRQMKINDRCWYSGTPEPDRFKLQPNAATSLCNGGAALLVEITAARMVPVVRPVATGRYKWHSVEKTLVDDMQIELFEQELRALDKELDTVVLNLRVRGALSLTGRKAFEDRIVQSLGAALRALQFDETGLVLSPTDRDLDEIDRAGFIRVAADRLKGLADSKTDSRQAQLAGLALKRLYIEHLRQGARP
jgi:DNA repair exonuclease SbcCD nuclease subunit